MGGLDPPIQSKRNTVGIRGPGWPARRPAMENFEISVIDIAMTDQNTLKRAVAAKALDYVTDGMKLGLGSGSTAEIFVELLAARGFKNLTCVPTSEKTAALARKLGLTLAELDDTAPLDLVIDGADEADRDLNLIKGGGGMLLREKIVAAASKQMVVIAD